MILNFFMSYVSDIKMVFVNFSTFEVENVHRNAFSVIVVIYLKRKTSILSYQ